MEKAKAELDLMIEGTEHDEALQVSELVRKAMVMGVFHKLDAKGPNECPVLWLEGERAQVESFILENYDTDPENLGGYRTVQ